MRWEGEKGAASVARGFFSFFSNKKNINNESLRFFFSSKKIKNDKSLPFFFLVSFRFGRFFVSTDAEKGNDEK